MDVDFSKDALTRFLDCVGEKGLVNPSTAQGWRVAVGNILDNLTASEEADVRSIDVESAFRKFVNRNGGKFAPRTLTEYRRRVDVALQEFNDWSVDPAGYKPKGGTRSRMAPNGERSPTRQPKGTPEDKQSKGTRDTGPRSSAPEAPTQSSGLPLSYPIRPDFLAQVVIPRDLTVNEAKRLGAFIMTLAVDFQPQ
jgi:hypothetical protein